MSLANYLIPLASAEPLVSTGHLTLHAIAAPFNRAAFPLAVAMNAILAAGANGNQNGMYFLSYLATHQGSYANEAIADKNDVQLQTAIINDVYLATKVTLTPNSFAQGGPAWNAAFAAWQSYNISSTVAVRIATPLGQTWIDTPTSVPLANWPALLTPPVYTRRGEEASLAIALVPLLLITLVAVGFGFALARLKQLVEAAEVAAIPIVHTLDVQSSGARGSRVRFADDDAEFEAMRVPPPRQSALLGDDSA